MSELNEFGKIFIEQTRDLSIAHIDKKIEGTMKGESAKIIQELLADFTDEQKETIKYIVSETVNETIFNFLNMFEQYEEISLLYNNINLNNESDGLAGELYTEDGWIDKYSKQRK